jgi:flagellar basal body P-ring protein FlgI
MRWFSCFALILYLSLLVTPKLATAHDSRLSPLAGNQFQAVNPLMGQATVVTAQDFGDDNESSLTVISRKAEILSRVVISVMPAALPLKSNNTAHPVRAPPTHS